MEYDPAFAYDSNIPDTFELVFDYILKVAGALGFVGGFVLLVSNNDLISASIFIGSLLLLMYSVVIGKLRHSNRLQRGILFELQKANVQKAKVEVD